MNKPDVTGSSKVNPCTGTVHTISNVTWMNIISKALFNIRKFKAYKFGSGCLHFHRDYHATKLIEQLYFVCHVG